MHSAVVAVCPAWERYTRTRPRSLHSFNLTCDTAAKFVLKPTEGVTNPLQGTVSAATAKEERMEPTMIAVLRGVGEKAIGLGSSSGCDVWEGCAGEPGARMSRVSDGGGQSGHKPVAAEACAIA